MASFRKLIPHVGRLGALPLRSSTAAVAAPVRSMAGVAAQNPHLSELPADYLYHLGLSDDRSGELEVRWLPMLIPALNILTHWMLPTPHCCARRVYRGSVFFLGGFLQETKREREVARRLKVTDRVTQQISPSLLRFVFLQAAQHLTSIYVCAIKICWDAYRALSAAVGCCIPITNHLPTFRPFVFDVLRNEMKYTIVLKKDTDSTARLERQYTALFN